MKPLIFAAVIAALATPSIAQPLLDRMTPPGSGTTKVPPGPRKLENWINRDCNEYAASAVPSIKPGSVSPRVLEKLRQKDAPKIEAARQECERRKQQQIEAKAAREEAERQAKIEAARQEKLRKEAEQEANG